MPAASRAIAIVLARDEEAALPGVLAGLPAGLDVVVVDDGSTDDTARLARSTGATVISHTHCRGLGAALRTGLAHAADGNYQAAVYLDGDGEYDPGEADTLVAAVLNHGADYVIGSRFLGRRHGMARHRSATNRLLTRLMARMTGTPMTDSQSGYRAFSGTALAAARIRHDYNYAQVLTLSLWGQRIEPVEVPITYTRRTSGRSFVRHGEYLRKVTPALIAEYREARVRRRGTVRSPSAALRPSPRRS